MRSSTSSTASDTTSTYRALDHAFDLTVEGSPALERYLTGALRDLRAPAGSLPDTSFLVTEDAASGWAFRVAHEAPSSGTTDQISRRLMWNVNRRAVDPAEVGVHAGAIELDGAVCLLVGASNAGKTTLTAGLVRRGADYFTDELVVLDEAGNVRPYRKPLVIGAGSHRLFPELAPEWPDDQPDPPTSVWLVPPTGIRPDCLASAGPVTHVVFINHQGARSTTLAELSGSEATVCLLENVLHDHPGAYTLDWAADLATQASCYRLVAEDLERSCDLVLEMLGRRQS